MEHWGKWRVGECGAMGKCSDRECGALESVKRWEVWNDGACAALGSVERCEKLSIGESGVLGHLEP